MTLHAIVENQTKTKTLSLISFTSQFLFSLCLEVPNMADDVGETCYTELCLGLGSNTKSSWRNDRGGSVKLDNNKQQNNNKKSSFIDDHLMATDHHSAGSNSDSDNSSHRKKKLRLTKEQSTLLEDSFMLQTTLIPFQKQSLADKLNLKPRQVEVWFQNRRARNKLKQTEEDCELLKRCCETLTTENQRLKKQLHDLKSSYKLHPFPFDILSLEPSPSANSVTCSLCKKNVV